MSKLKYFIGIDTSKKTLDVTLRRGSEFLHHESISNTGKSIIGWLTRLRNTFQFGISEALFCVEHTGVYNAHILEVAKSQNWNLCLEHSVQILRSIGLQRGKNDKVDSNRISEYAYKNRESIRLWESPRIALLKLKQLIRQRKRLVLARKSLLQPFTENKAFDVSGLLGEMKELTSSAIAGIEASIASTEQEILSLYQSDKKLNRLNEIITSIKGIGPITSAHFIVYTDEFKTIQEARKFACYAGIAPFEHRSGSSVRGKTRTSKKANLQVKSMLHMSSLAAMRFNHDLKVYYERKVASGKNKMSVLNAVKNKLIHRVFACVKEDRLYIENIT